MTELTVTQVYAVGAPLILTLIFVEALISNLQNTSYYKNEDTLCTIGLLTGNILMVFAVKGLTLALHFYLYQFRLFDLASIIPA